MQSRIGLLLALMSLLAECCFSFADDQSITFNALTGEFSPKSIGKVRPHDQFSLLVTNVDTFSHKYTISTQATDYHNLPIPSSLSGIFLSKPATQTTKNFPSIVLKLSKSELETRLEEEFNHLISDKASLSCPPTSYIIEGIVSLISPGGTNFDIRQRAIDYWKKQLDPLLVGNQSVKDAIDKIDRYLKVTADTEEGYKAAHESVVPSIQVVGMWIADDPYQDYKVNIDRWNGDYTSYKGNDYGSQFDGDNEEVKAFEADMKTKTDEFGAQYSRWELKTVFYSLLDPDIVPIVLQRDLGSFDADSLRISVQVDRVVPAYLTPDPAKADNAINLISTSNLAWASKTYSIKADISDRWVMDYSLGIAWISYGKQNYYVDASKFVQKGKLDFLNIGAVALGQLYPTGSGASWVSVGPCLGIAVADQSNFIAGLSVIWSVARKARLSLSGGFSVGQITDLNGDSVGSTALGNTVNTASYVTWGGFLSLTGSYSF
jgi:hypothetical protein